MKWCYLVAAVVLTAAFGLPFREFDTGKLLPIRTVQVACDGETVQLVSEVGEGSGASWQEAVRDLRSNAAGEVFFDTAEQIVFCGTVSQPLLREICADLRPSAQVYEADALQDPEGLNEYLSAHESALTLADLRILYII